MRLAAVRAVRNLYDGDDYVSALQEFMTRFKSRIMEMMRDKDAEVIVEILKLLERLVEVQAVTMEEVSPSALVLLGDANTGVRAASATLVAGSLERLGRMALAGETSTSTNSYLINGGRKGQAKAPSSSRARDRGHGTPDHAEWTVDSWQVEGLAVLLERLEGDDGEEDDGVSTSNSTVDAASLWAAEVVAKGAVVALAPHCPALTNWRVLVDAAGLASLPTRPDARQTRLCRILRWAMETATVSDAPRKSKSSLEMAARHQHAATDLLLTRLGPLIREHQASPTRCAALLPIFLLLQLELFPLKKQDAAFKALLATIKDILFKHASPAVLSAAGASLAYAVASGPGGTRSKGAATRANARALASSALADAAAAVRALTPQELADEVAALEAAGPDAAGGLADLVVALDRTLVLLPRPQDGMGEVMPALAWEVALDLLDLANESH